MSQQATSPTPPPIAVPSPPGGTATAVKGGTRLTVWPTPGLIKISPERDAAMFGDLSGTGRGTAPNAVWDGRTIQLFGGLGEYVSYQLVIDRTDLTQPLSTVSVSFEDLTGPGGRIGGDNIELFKNWYAKNEAGA